VVTPPARAAQRENVTGCGVKAGKVGRDLEAQNSKFKRRTKVQIPTTGLAQEESEWIGTWSLELLLNFEL
jgi:hypothetical protein